MDLEVMMRRLCLRIMTVIAGIDATGEEKDEMVARIVGYRNDLDWRDYK